MATKIKSHADQIALLLGNELSGYSTRRSAPHRSARHQPGWRQSEHRIQLGGRAQRGAIRVPGVQRHSSALFQLDAKRSANTAALVHFVVDALAAAAPAEAARRASQAGHSG